MFELASGTENIRIPKFLLQTVVENIFKHGFSPEQFLSIFLESALEEQNGVRGLRMTVEDNGCGMTEETRKHIFEKFYQGDTSHAMAGNGLGLALSLRVLQLNDYKIEVESEPGRGSKFTVIIPKR